ncbi:MAG: 4Fe-4S binding protein [Clostridiales Family XIII bacterium]|jgi:ferredoxin|nr:4Fe-4S binding protein [Clostridiales Family XIII bacterium]
MPLIRKIIEIDEEKCDGCGLCASACHEGAIGIVGGKAKLLRDDYCDGLGDCLPACPTGAIRFTQREAAAYNAEEVKANQLRAARPHAAPRSAGSGRETHGVARNPQSAPGDFAPPESELRQWPVQIKLAPVNAPYFDGANLLVAASCAAYAKADFHAELMRGKITLIGCPKLDGVDYSVKLGEILADNDIKSLTVARMEVPCCGGIEQAAGAALKNAGKPTPLRVITLGVGGETKGDRTGS